jgi:hypothetical protein
MTLRVKLFHSRHQHLLRRSTWLADCGLLWIRDVERKGAKPRPRGPRHGVAGLSQASENSGLSTPV